MIQGKDSAMPYVVPGSVEDRYVESGLTIRQHFAVMAMQGILANPEFLKNYQNVDIQIAAVKNADALITELNKETNP